ncbi:hypothetical protein [Micromonospora sp. NPDC005806]|uniref:hypothetical protein n=1 Tax=Micromonospora sp. NPDC005806 TaxID=3364234 RepID=UPI0036CB81E2
MTTILVVVAAVALLVTAVVGYVSWRDRQRSIPDEDGTAARDAESRRHRYETQRHASQHHTLRRDEPNSM